MTAGQHWNSIDEAAPTFATHFSHVPPTDVSCETVLSSDNQHLNIIAQLWSFSLFHGFQFPKNHRLIRKTLIWKEAFGQSIYSRQRGAYVPTSEEGQSVLDFLTLKKKWRIKNVEKSWRFFVLGCPWRLIRGAAPRKFLLKLSLSKK